LERQHKEPAFLHYEEQIIQALRLKKKSKHKAPARKADAATLKD
jgi:hypothetical protein